MNYGVPEDYDYLAKQGIDVKGKIVIARYGKSWRGTKPKVAAEHGAVGCLIYSDPRDDGYFQGDVYPKGPMRPPDGVQRGSVHGHAGLRGRSAVARLGFRARVEAARDLGSEDADEDSGDADFLCRRHARCWNNWTGPVAPENVARRAGLHLSHRAGTGHGAFQTGFRQFHPSACTT